MNSNRYFPGSSWDIHTLKPLFDQLAVVGPELERRWYRAQLQHSERETLSLDRMSAPPPDLATPGRANPAGIPYLYASSDPNTAISELRPHSGELASVLAYDLLPEVRSLG